MQGYVSECLAELLEAEGMKLEKPRHAANYEVDGTVDVPGSPVLIEIKTGVSPADVYAGVGQLTVYPILLPDLAKHRKILLLPGRPGPRLVKALEGCGVELHSYELKRRPPVGVGSVRGCAPAPLRRGGRPRGGSRRERRGAAVTGAADVRASLATWTASDEWRRIPLPPSVRALVVAHRDLVASYAATSLRFTLDGRLVGDIAEATAAEAFGLRLCGVRTAGVDAHALDGSSVQIKASGIGKGPAFTPGRGASRSPGLPDDRFRGVARRTFATTVPKDRCGRSCLRTSPAPSAHRSPGCSRWTQVWQRCSV